MTMLTISISFATMVYGDEGKDTRERLWQETLDEFKSVNVQDILDNMKASKE